MGPNAIILLNETLGLLMQAQQYQQAVAKAQAEGRDVTDAEVAAAKASAMAAIDALAKS